MGLRDRSLSPGPLLSNAPFALLLAAATAGQGSCALRSALQTRLGRPALTFVAHELRRAQTRCTVHVFDCTCDSTHGCDYQVPPAIRARVVFHFKVRVLVSSSPYGRAQIQALVCCKNLGSPLVLLTPRAACAHASVCTKTMCVCTHRDFASSTCWAHNACEPSETVPGRARPR